MNGNCVECDRRWHCEIEPAKCDNLSEPVTMTNADKIREMSDEELAKYLYQMQKNILRYVATVIGYSEEFDFADEAPDLLEWLQQPAETEGEK